MLLNHLGRNSNYYRIIRNIIYNYRVCPNNNIIPNFYGTKYFGARTNYAVISYNRHSVLLCCPTNCNTCPNAHIVTNNCPFMNNNA